MRQASSPRPGWLALSAAVPAALLLALPSGVCAQSIESDLTPEAEALVKDADHYALPDIADKTLAEAHAHDEHERFLIKFGFAILPADYTTFSQDANSKAQVGNQQDTFEARSLRLMARGYFELFRKWNYIFSYEYKGFANSPGDPDWAATDVSLSTEFEHVGKLTFGKFKEPFAYEMVGDSANLPHPERLLSPFFTSRNIGVQLSNTMLDQRGTWAVGWYNDWWKTSDSFGDSGNDAAARVTLLPVWSDDGARYLHLAASVRYYGGDNNKLRFRGQPASHVSDYYVDTGNLAGDHAWNTGLELLWNYDGYSVLAEYIDSSVSSAANGNPDFSGYYVTAAWVLTGEHRPYDRKAGYARRVLPQGRWGAWELMGRYGAVDLNDKSVRGGAMDGWWVGLNWWGTRRWKASVTYGDIDLDRNGITGNTKTWLSRIQWIY
jgi:phosphate-selective porin OprO and OprP